MRSNRLLILSSVVACVALRAAPVGAQVRYGATPGYPSVSRFGSGFGAGSGYPAYGGPGFGYGGYGGYGVNNGVLSPANAAGYRFATGGLPNSQSQTVTDFRPLYSAITSLPGWYGGPTSSTESSLHGRTRAHPTTPREQLLSDDGSILWPSAAPDNDARRAAEQAVRQVVQEAKSSGNASVRHVVEAKNKVSAYARTSLTGVARRNAADAHGLEIFLVELGKTLETMALNY